MTLHAQQHDGISDELREAIIGHDGDDLRTSDQGTTFVQLLDEQGHRHTGGVFGRIADALSHAELREMYRDLVLLRRFDQEATALQRHGELALWAPCLGQEAAQVGLGRGLRSQDFAYTSYREHGVALQRGLAPRDLLRIFRGVSHGGWDPHAHNLSAYEIMIGAQTLHAAGYAMGVKLEGAAGTGDVDSDVAVVTCFGDGATSEGDVAEALTFAASFQAPVLFFCQNNQWAISVPKQVQTPSPIYRRGEGYGIPGIRVDGNDLLASYAVSRFALDRVRSGAGPLFVEAYTYRMGAHTTADDPTRYRSAEEVERWKRADPLERVRRHLLEIGAADEDFFTVLDAEAEQWGAGVREACLSLETPGLDALFDHIYADSHALVEQERAEFRAYENSFGETVEEGA
ncbi:thiamine pyrophosphate-dependent dehydrogenase E1 component subunit alpha [Citricoccus sp. NR2]|uniref:thiamine pyrophosphate-dependent dehydrogenase E1 component subunit alpha n=1 Tax=Citricoccus sp. NR2 TaxID=3004095 RepID=UPI0022DE4F74|nr:thiamine pyrophosphate-dependent dehydrogenase E1 component subunit alpha [Citricoccus sp. NR2]WBL19434.1 thiamine pyrophosphate-dependent dehydrogenase E1 component subunit alpha [Citricoccus sp. NR2]